MEGIIRRLPSLRLVDPDQKFLVVPGGPVTIQLKFDAN